MKTSLSKKGANILWVPAPPSGGIISMFRYWDELRKERNREFEQSKYSIDDFVTPNLEDKTGTRLARFFEKYISYPIRISHHKNYNVIHGLAHDAGLYLRYASKSCVKIVTVHDLIPMRYGEDLSASQLRRFKSQMQMLKNMDALVAVSEHTANELTDLLEIPAHKIRVIPNGVNLDLFAEKKKCLKILERLDARPYIFSLSSSAKRKNLMVLPEVFRNLKMLNVKCDLVRAGATLPASIERELRELKVNVIELGICSDEALASLYQHAACFLFPSLYEGFGLPVLEAMASGCPVVASNTSSLPEVAGSAAELVDPMNAHSIAVAIVNIFEDREKYKTAGLQRAAEFSWTKHYNSLLRLYDEFS